MKDFENAVLNGDTEFLKEALPNHNLVNSKNVDKRTPLLTASFLGHDEIVTLLLANGADVTATDPSGITSVHYAAGMGHTGILDELLESGGNLNAKITTGTLKGYTPLHFACLNLKAGSVELLLGRNPRKLC
jgi:ankyrin repeat protein